MVVVSVVRDFEMYNRLVRSNPFNSGATFVPIDNREKNEGVPVGYNRFLDNYDYSNEDWFVFCHEDWEILEDWQRRLPELDKDSLYGPIGVAMYGSAKVVLGQIFNSNKDGSGFRTVGVPCDMGTEVETFDCQCILVHSTLVEKCRLRFDEDLPFDLYVEDLCICAYERHRVRSRILSVKCRHWSFGNIEARFHIGVERIQQKHPRLSKWYATTVNDTVWGGGEGGCRAENAVSGSLTWAEMCRYRARRFLYREKVTSSGYRLIKMCGIPVYRKKYAGLGCPGFVKPAGLFPPSRLAFKYLNGLRGIEIGGAYHNQFFLDTLNVNYTSDETSFSVEEQKMGQGSLKVDVVANGDDLPFKDNVWDFVINSHVLEHFWDPIKTLHEWMRVVRPGGYLFMIIPHKERTFDKVRPRTRLDELIRRHAGEGIDPGTHEHFNVWITEDLLELCRHLGLNVIDHQDVDDKVGNGFTIVVRK